MGDTAAQLRLCCMYHEGTHGLHKNTRLAVEWARAAAQGQHIEAQYWLGCLYAKGDGVEQDRAEALRWYLRAAKNGHPKAAAAVQAMEEQAKQDAAASAAAAAAAPK